MKSVLISVKPQLCNLIASGKKTVEVRKNRPKIETPFKCYIYCAKAKNQNDVLWTNFNDVGIFARKSNGKVIGEFVCDAVLDFNSYEIACGTSETAFEELPRSTCITREEMLKYCGDKVIYTWHISDLVIYDKPKELSEFNVICKKILKKPLQCNGCQYYRGYSDIWKSETVTCKGRKALTRPPQSWCYVEGSE